ncbi:GNAT family N-acetyltransferase [Rosistilla oblonga]|uniref:GNAT family N-acetyltransferase n=1 Tax=Rosistilla oblonga TaxID=2527990 RepID=UPI003A977581
MALSKNQRLLRINEFLSQQGNTATNLRLCKESDAEFTLELRMNPSLNKHLSSVDNSIHQQRSWIKQYKNREAAGEEFYFIIEHDNAPVGTVRIYDFKDDSFCWGSWIIMPGTSTKAAISSVQLVYRIGFEILQFPSCHFDVRKDNKSVNRFHSRMGAQVTGEERDLIFYRITPADTKEYFSLRGIRSN